MKGSLKEKQRELSEYVFNFAFEEFYKYKFATVQDQLYSYYSGEYKVAEINEDIQVDYYSGKTTTSISYDLHTSSESGSQSTPYFKEPFDENTATDVLEWGLTIHVPGNLVEESKLVFDVESDMGWDDISISRIEGQIFMSFYHRN